MHRIYWGIFLLLHMATRLHAQEAGQQNIHVLDRTYTKDAASDRLIRNEVFNTPVYEVDEARLSCDYKEKLTGLPSGFLSACIYVDVKGYTDSIKTAVSQARKISQKAYYHDPTTLPLPVALRYYSSALPFADGAPGNELLMRMRIGLSSAQLCTSFYFKRNEVTNGEYREFVNWVRDSIARKILNIGPNEKIVWADTLVQKKLESLYLPISERFYRRPELDVQQLRYRYHSSDGNDIDLQVYPDTVVWVNGFGELQPAAEAHTNMYFWHRAYDHYPVVGVSHQQAEAYLHWLGDRWNEKLQAAGMKVTFTLPAEYQWELLACKTKSELINISYLAEYDRQYIPDLQLENTHSVILKYPTGEGAATVILPAAENLESSLPFRSAMQLFPCNMRYGKKALPREIVSECFDENGVGFMGNNVSEWMSDSAGGSWRAAVNLRIAQLELCSDEGYTTLANRIRATFDSIPNSAFLIRGGNWFDGSLSSQKGKNISGINKKAFALPGRQFATVGFRYVATVRRK